MTTTGAPALLGSLRHWSAHRWVVAVAVTMLTVVVVGMPTDLIDTPVFSREVAVSWWAWPALAVTAALAGLVAATYVRTPSTSLRRDRAGRWGTAGGVLGFFAVGCPVCNKLVLLALGTSGALQFFQPIQPLLAVASIGMLTWSLVTRIRRESACTVTSTAAAGPR